MPAPAIDPEQSVKSTPTKKPGTNSSASLERSEHLVKEAAEHLKADRQMREYRKLHPPNDPKPETNTNQD